MLSLRAVFAISVLLVLGGCGGGSSPNSPSTPSVPEGSKTSTQLAQICAPENPLVGDASGSIQLGSLTDEKNWVKAYMTERYLWYKDIPEIDAADPRYSVTTNRVLDVPTSLVNYFYDLLSPLKTSSGSSVDKFSYLIPTKEWNNFSEGVELGYGISLKVSGTTGNRIVKISYVYPDTPAAKAGVLRGDQIVTVDGFSVSTSTTQGLATLNEALFPTKIVPHTFGIVSNGRNLDVTLAPAKIDLQEADHKVLTLGSKKVGYLLFNSHIIPAVPYLAKAATEFEQQGVTELVVDLRYNLGGSLEIASALAGTVAGKAKTNGKIFELVKFSDKLSSNNFVFDFLFFNTGNQEPPTLNLSKIYVLTTASTCSASESFINGLRGVDVEVELIGSTTCGKPYGFIAQDNCGMTYAAMELEGVNHKGEGGYFDGMAPQCAAADDLTHQLGDPSEGMLAVALNRIQGKTCTQAQAAAGRFTRLPLQDDGRLQKPAWQANKFLTRKF